MDKKGLKVVEGNGIPQARKVFVPPQIFTNVRRELVRKMRAKIATDQDFEEKRMDETVLKLLKDLA